MWGWFTRKPFLCHLAWTTRQDRRCPGRCSPEITDTTFRRDCHRSGKGAWTTAEQLRFLLLPPRRGRRSQVWGAQVRPELPPECLTVRLRRKRRLAPPRSVAGSSAAAASGVLIAALPGQYGGERGTHAGFWRRVLGVGGGERKVDGGGDANGEEPGRWMPRVGTFSGSHPNPLISANVPVLSRHRHLDGAHGSLSKQLALLS